MDVYAAMQVMYTEFKYLSFVPSVDGPYMQKKLRLFPTGVSVQKAGQTHAHALHTHRERHTHTHTHTHSHRNLRSLQEMAHFLSVKISHGVIHFAIRSPYAHSSIQSGTRWPHWDRGVFANSPANNDELSCLAVHEISRHLQVLGVDIPPLLLSCPPFVLRAHHVSAAAHSSISTCQIPSLPPQYFLVEQTALLEHTVQTRQVWLTANGASPVLRRNGILCFLVHYV